MISNELTASVDVAGRIAFEGAKSIGTKVEKSKLQPRRKICGEGERNFLGKGKDVGGGESEREGEMMKELQQK